MKRYLGTKVFLAIALGYTLLILVLSLIKAGFLPFAKVHNADKVFHLCAYFGMTLVWHFYYFSKKNTTKYKPVLLICGLTILFGIFIEVLQGIFTDYRYLDYYDMLANTTGVVIAFILLTVFNPPRKVKSR